MFSGWTPRYGASSGYSAPPAADTGLQSFRDQHLAQLEQLQRMHQRQLESVLPVGSPVPPRPYFPPRQSYPYPPPYSHNVPPPGYQSPALPPDTDKPPPPPPTAEQQPPPPPPPDGGGPPNTTSTPLEEQQQYWYNQHLQNLQQKAKSQDREAPPPAPETAPPPSYVSAPPAQQPPPPPVEDSRPPLPAENASTGINLSEDPEQAQRLKTLQEAAAHWQQHEQHRLGFQYQGIMQKHSAMQQLLQRYQQIVQDPPHLAAMTVDVQLQHYEMQQKQFLPLHQEWENQYKKWQELLQTYPHKDQLQTYQVQWASWQSHIKATKTHLKDKVASLKSLKQQYGGSHYIGGIAMVPPPYPAYSPVISPAVPAALPTGLAMPPPFTAPVAPVYGAGPPPALPPVYVEATPPLPPVTAPPPPPPASSAPPPPPPVTSPPEEDAQPPLPPSTETQPPPPATNSESLSTSSAPSTSASPPDTTTGPAAAASVPPAEKEPPTTAVPFLPATQAPPTGLSYQAQQALKNGAPPVPSHNPPLSQSTPPVPAYNSSLGPSAPPVPFHNPPLGHSVPPPPFLNAPLGQGTPPVPSYNAPLGYSVPPLPTHKPPLGQSAPPVPSNNPPLGQTAPPVPYHNPPLEVPSPGMEKQSDDTKHLNPPGPPPVPDQEPLSTVPPPPLAGMKMGAQYEGPRESRFSTQGPSFGPPRFPPPGSLGFHSSRPIHDRDTQHWTNDQKDQSTVADTPKQYGEPSNRTAPTSRWDRPKDPPDQAWEKPKAPQVSQSPAKTAPEYSTEPVLDREPKQPAEMWNRPDGPQFNRRGGPAEDTGSKWDQPHESRWGAPKEPPGDRWSNSQDRWGAENTSSPMDRFGDSQNSGMNRFGGSETSPYDRYGDGSGPPYDRTAAPQAPFRERFGHPDGSQRFRFNAPEMQPRGRARFPGVPPRGRFPFPDGQPRHRFSGAEGRAPGFGYHETFSRDRFGGPEQPSGRDHFEGPEQQERFGVYEQSPSQERFGGPDIGETSYQEGPRDPKVPPSHNRFAGMNDRFGGPDAPDRPKGPEFPPSHREYFRGPDMPPAPGDKFKGHEMPTTTGDRFKGPDMPSSAEDHYKNPEMLPPRDRFKGPEMPLPAEDSFRNPDIVSPGDRFKGHKMPPPPGERFGAAEMQPPYQQNRFGDFDGPPRDNWSHSDKKEETLHENRESRVPFNDRWASGSGGRPEWPRGRVDGGNRPSLLGDAPLEKPKIQSNTENAPKESYQSKFNKKPVPKAAEARLGAQSLSAAQRDAKEEQKDEMKPDEPTKESTPKNAESPAAQHGPASEKGTSASSELHKPHEGGDSSKGETQASGLPKTDPQAGQPLPVPKEANQAVPGTLLPSDVATGVGPAGDKGPLEKSDLDSSDLGKPLESQVSVPEAAQPDAPNATPSMAGKTEEITDGSNLLRKQEPFQMPPINRSGGLLPTPTTGIGGHFGPHANQGFRPQAPHLLQPVRPGDPWAPPVRPGGPRAAPPVRPGGPRPPPPFRPGGPGAAPQFRPGAPGAAPPVRPGGPRAAPPIGPGGPRAAPPVRPGGPRAGPPIGPGGPRAAPPVRLGGPRLAPPVRPGGPRAGHPIRPGAPGPPFSSWEEPLDREGQEEDRNYAAPMGGEDPYDESDEGVMGERHGPHGPEGRHGRPDFPDEEADDTDGYFHHEPGRPMGFRQNEGSLDPEHYEEDWPENYDMRFDHRGRGRARGFMRGRPPPRPGNRDMMDVLDERGFDPRGHLPDERPSFREGLNEPPQFGRESFPREPRLADRERFPLDPQLDMRRREFLLDDQRLEEWERERYLRSRDPYMDPYMREELPPAWPPHLPHDVDVRCDPWYDRNLDKDLDRVLSYNRLERPHLFDRDHDRDYPRIPEDLDLLLRDRDWLPPRRPLSPHRPFSPGRSRSPLPPLPPIERYLDDRWRLEREMEDRDFRDRGELRIREYPERPLWHEGRNPDLLPERSELVPKDGGWYPPEERVQNEGLNQLPDPSSAALPDQSELPGGDPSAAGVLALSQRQHEIILKAAQELKMLREQKQQLDNLKNFFGETESSNTGKLGSDAVPGADPLKPPSDPVTGVDKSSSVAGRPVGAPFSGWDDDRRGPNSGLPVGSKLSGIQQTVDYAHGRDLAIGKVEQTPYGERVMLLPEPPVDRGLPFQKDYLLDSFDRDFRDRDPYYERMKSADRRDYDRDRSDSHRDRGDHDRDRDRHSRDDRSSYRDKESSSRRGTSDRKGDRPSYEVPPPSYGGGRRGYPEERPVIAPPIPIPPPEKKPETKNVDDLLKKPGRDSRPDRIVVIMRGLPGSGKTHVAKLIRDKEVEYGGSAPRVLSLDDYFITEVEKVEKDPETGKKVKIKAMEYEYEPEMEETYRSGMLKTFKKTLDDGFFPFIILDSIHDRVRHFEQFWSAAKTKGFEVYVAEITADTQTCAKRNVHSRKLKDINKMADNWESAPRHMIRLDIRSLLQDAAIEEVEMEDSEPSVEPQKDEKKASEEEDNDRVGEAAESDGPWRNGYLPKSKWEMDTSEAKLDKLDGLKVNKRKRDYGSVASRMEDYLQLPDDYDTRESEPGKKRVRWADLEEKKDADRKRAIGFVVGQTDWEKITDKSGHLAERALNRTKYI